MKCPVSDDNDVKCPNIMTKAEFKQDGMCWRCGDLMWAWCTKWTPIIFDKKKKIKRPKSK